MQCPRCHADLVVEKEYHGIDVDRCPSCEGRWLDHDELDQLEATVPSTSEEREPPIKYAGRQGELPCPVCGKRMTAFNYRAYNLELDACEEGHGWWLDAGEEGRLRAMTRGRGRGPARPLGGPRAGFSRPTGLFDVKAHRVVDLLVP